MCKSLWVSLAITVLASYGSAIAEEEPSMYDKEMERMETNRRFDKLNLRGNTGFVSDTSRDFLIPPPEGQDADYDIASTPPNCPPDDHPQPRAGIFHRSP